MKAGELYELTADCGGHKKGTVILITSTDAQRAFYDGGDFMKRSIFSDNLKLIPMEKQQTIAAEPVQFENIPATGFSATDNETETKSILMQRNANGAFTFSDEAIYAFMRGAEQIALNQDRVPAQDMRLIIGLSLHKPEPGRVIRLSREQVLTLRKFLETRITHCEKERDERSDKFSPDTYIMMKHLLLDLREWLLGEEVI